MSNEYADAGPCLWMVCYKESPCYPGQFRQTYWNVYPADCEADATKQAERDDLFKHGRHHTYTVPYNKAGMTVEQTYAEHLANRASA